jgi:hypothetical protein
VGCYGGVRVGMPLLGGLPDLPGGRQAFQLLPDSSKVKV